MLRPLRHAAALGAWRRSNSKRQQIDEWKAGIKREFEGAVACLKSKGMQPDRLINEPNLMPSYLRAIEHVPERIERELEAGHALSEEDLAIGTQRRRAPETPHLPAAGGLLLGFEFPILVNNFTSNRWIY